MAIRIFGLTRSGVRKTWADTAYATPQEYAAALITEAPGRQLIAWATVPVGPPPPRTDQDFYNLTRALIAQRQYFGTKAEALALLEKWANAPLVKVAISGAAPDEPMLTSKAGKPEHAKPGQTQIVQDWLLTDDAQGLADRAWAATMAACKGA